VLLGFHSKFANVYDHGQAIPVKALRVPGVRGSQISRHSAPEGVKVVSLKNRPPLPPTPAHIPGTHFC